MHRRTRTAHDADDHALNLSQWEQTYDQFSSGCFEGRMIELWLPGIQLFHESANQALYQSCAARQGALWFGIPTISREGPRIDARIVPDSTILFRAGGHQFELHTPQNYGIFGLVIDRHLLEEHLICTDADVSHLTNCGGILTVTQPLYQQILGTLSQALLRPDMSRDTTREEMANLQETLLDQIDRMMVAADPAASPDARCHDTRHQRQIVSDVVDIVRAEPSQPLSIAGLCQQMQVSRRTLQYCFQSVVGLSPLAYLRMLKLNGVRRGLRNVSGPHARVTQIATTWGFEHLGQFSKDYHRLFGELPSATLQRRTRQPSADEMHVG